MRGAAERAVLAAVLAGALVAGCDDKPAPKAPTASPAATEAKLARLPPQMVAAVSGGKTAEMISVHFALEGVPAVGKPLPVSIAIVTHRHFNSVSAIFNAPETLGLSAGKQLEQKENVSTEAVLDHKILLQPSEEGVFLLTAAVDTAGENGQETRIFSIPVIVHPAKPADKPSQPPPTG